MSHTYSVAFWNGNKLEGVRPMTFAGSVPPPDVLEKFDPRDLYPGPRGKIDPDPYGYMPRTHAYDLKNYSFQALTATYVRRVSLPRPSPATKVLPMDINTNCIEPGCDATPTVILKFGDREVGKACALHDRQIVREPIKLAPQREPSGDTDSTDWWSLRLPDGRRLSFRTPKGLQLEFREYGHGNVYVSEPATALLWFGVQQQ